MQAKNTTKTASTIAISQGLCYNESIEKKGQKNE
jgi:hypothetical protein